MPAVLPRGSHAVGAESHGRCVCATSPACGDVENLAQAGVVEGIQEIAVVHPVGIQRESKLPVEREVTFALDP